MIQEPYFLFPVSVFSSQALIRNDVIGKGAFGTSRSGGRTHQGVDFLGQVGNPVYSAKSGRIVYSGEGKGYGLYIEISHPDMRFTRYAHLSKLEVNLGDWTTAGQRIGYVGKTGNADSPRVLPHLHFEIRDSKKAVDPLPLMDPLIKVS